MSWTCGRVGVSTVYGGDGLAFDGPQSVSQQGDDLTVTGSLYGLAHNTMVFRAGQIIGLLGGDEPVVPCTFSDAPELDGFYRVTDASCDYQLVGAGSGTAGYVPWSVGLRRVANWRLPRLELPTTWATPGNIHGVSSGTALVGADAADFSAYPPFSPNAYTVRPSAEGSGVACHLLTSTPKGQGTGRRVALPGNVYRNGCRAELDMGSGVWAQLVGRADLAPSGVVRVSNAIVRCAVTFGAGTAAFTVQHWDGSSAWVTPVSFGLLRGASEFIRPLAVSVIRNTPEQVTIRCSTDFVSSQVGVTTVDFTVRRGSRWVTILARSHVTDSWTLGFTTTTASTAATPGLRRTSALNGMYDTIVSSTVSTTSTTLGRISTAVGFTTAFFGISAMDSTGGVTSNINEWWSQVSERTLVVSN